MCKVSGRIVCVGAKRRREMKNKEFIVKNGILKKYNGSKSIVKIPEGIKEIGKEAFFQCYVLEEVFIPDNVTNIHESAFARCENLGKIHFSTKLRIIEDYAFSDCYSLKKIELPSSIEIIGEEAFSNCINLEEVSLPNSEIDMGANVFSLCNIDSIDSTAICAKNGLVIEDDGKTLAYVCNRYLEKIIVPKGIDYIDSAFSNMTDLKEVVLPDTIYCIDDYAFYNCTSLEKIIIPPAVAYIGEYAFCKCSSLDEITIPESTHTIGEYAFADCKKIKSFQLNSTSLELKEGVFSGCCSLSEFSAPNLDEYDGEFEFRRCNIQNLNFCEANIINGLDMSEDGKTVHYCANYSMKAVHIPKGTEEIEDAAFNNCHNLEEIYIPSTVKKIGDYCFSNCKKLKEIHVESENTRFEEPSFSGCMNLSIESQNRLKTLGYVFEEDELEELTKEGCF